MDLGISTKTFGCTLEGGLAHIILNQPDRGNPIDGDFCREFGLCIAELSERADVRSVLVSARGRLFSAGGDLMSLSKQGDALPRTIKAWTADLHAAIARMVRMRPPVVAAVHGNVAGGSASLVSPLRRLGCDPQAGSLWTGYPDDELRNSDQSASEPKTGRRALDDYNSDGLPGTHHARAIWVQDPPSTPIDNIWCGALDR